jgi:acyl carrier protein
MEEKIREIMAAVFDVPAERIDENASPDSIENWDSLNHMKLILALEGEFDVQFTDEEVLEMQNYKLVVYTLSKYKRWGAKQYPHDRS